MGTTLVLEGEIYMISKGFKYKAKWIKHPQDKYTTFQISTKDKKTQQFKNFNIFSQGKIEMKDGDEVQIVDITGVDHTEFFSQKHGKTFLNVTVFAEVEVVGMGDDPVPEATLSGDDLPW